jgi:hypothetical protein
MPLRCSDRHSWIRSVEVRDAGLCSGSGANTFMSSLQGALQIDAFDAHVLAYGAELPLVQAVHPSMKSF